MPHHVVRAAELAFCSDLALQGVVYPSGLRSQRKYQTPLVNSRQAVAERRAVGVVNVFGRKRAPALLLVAYGVLRIKLANLGQHSSAAAHVLHYAPAVHSPWALGGAVATV